MTLYHGSKDIVEYPEIRKPDLTKISTLASIVRTSKNRQNGGRQGMEKRDTLTGTSIQKIQN